MRKLIDDLSPVMLEEDLQKLKEALEQPMIKTKPKAMTDHERLEWLHSNWKKKQAAVPESDEDLFCYRAEDGSEVRLKRKDVPSIYGEGDTPDYKLINVVKVSVGEAEKSAK